MNYFYHIQITKNKMFLRKYIKTAGFTSHTHNPTITPNIVQMQNTGFQAPLPNNHFTKRVTADNTGTTAGRTT
jgi:hypothetical protein